MEDFEFDDDPLEWEEGLGIENRRYSVSRNSEKRAEDICSCKRIT